MSNKIVVWKDGTYKMVSGGTDEFENDCDWLTTIEIPTEEWDSIRLIGRVRERFKELLEKEWDWRSFYSGWMEGRVDMLRIPKERGRLEGWEPAENEPLAESWLQERANWLSEVELLRAHISKLESLDFKSLQQERDDYSSLLDAVLNDLDTNSEIDHRIRRVLKKYRPSLVTPPDPGPYNVQGKEERVSEWNHIKIDRLCDVISIGEDHIAELQDELAGAQLSAKNAIEQNCQLIAERDRQAAAKQKQDRETAEYIDGLQNEIEKWKKDYGMVARIVNDRISDLNAANARIKELQEWHDSHC